MGSTRPRRPMFLQAVVCTPSCMTIESSHTLWACADSLACSSAVREMFDKIREGIRCNEGVGNRVVDFYSPLSFICDCAVWWLPWHLYPWQPCPWQPHWWQPESSCRSSHVGWLPSCLLTCRWYHSEECISQVLLFLRKLWQSWQIRSDLPTFYPLKFTLVNFKLIQLWHWPTANAHAPFCPKHMTIWADGFDLLNHMQRMDWLKALAAYFINEEKERSLRSRKVFLSLKFVYASTCQNFFRQIPKFANSPKFFC